MARLLVKGRVHPSARETIRLTDGRGLVGRREILGKEIEISDGPCLEDEFKSVVGQLMLRDQAQ